MNHIDPNPFFVEQNREFFDVCPHNPWKSFRLKAFFPNEGIPFKNKCIIIIHCESVRVENSKGKQGLS